MTESRTIKLVQLDEGHQDGVYRLYQRVAAKAGGIARQPHEITARYVGQFVRNTMARGIGLVANDGHRVVGEVHAYAPEPECFAHVLSDLTIAVDPAYQGQGVGRLLFEKLIDDGRNHYLHILRIELIVRESNQKAIDFYQSLGFVKEGKLSSRIHNLDDTYEADVPMAWVRKPCS